MVKLGGFAVHDPSADLNTRHYYTCLTSPYPLSTPVHTKIPRRCKIRYRLVNLVKCVRYHSHNSHSKSLLIEYQPTSKAKDVTEAVPPTLPLPYFPFPFSSPSPGQGRMPVFLGFSFVELGNSRRWRRGRWASPWLGFACTSAYL